MRRRRFSCTDSLRIDVRQYFLRNIDGDAAVRAAREKIKAKQALSDEDVLWLIVAPLAKSELPKQTVLEKCVELAKGIEDERLQTFVITGLLVATDKFIERQYSNSVRRWIGMTKIGQIIQEEIEAARAEAAMTARAEKNNIAKNMLRKGMNISDVTECTGLARADVEKLLLN
jgi:predicted transposase/invertase (TIGR01784 family)